MKRGIITVAIAVLGVMGAGAYVFYELFLASDEKTITDRYVVSDAALQHGETLSKLRSSLITGEGVIIADDIYVKGHRIRRGGGVILSIRRYEWTPNQNHTDGFEKLTVFFPGKLPAGTESIDLQTSDTVIFWSSATTYGVVAGPGAAAYHPASEICLGFGTEGKLRRISANGNQFHLILRILRAPMPGCGGKKYFEFDEYFIVSKKEISKLNPWEGKTTGIIDVLEISRPISIWEVLGLKDIFQSIPSE